MEATQLIFTLFCTVLFCLGWRIVSEDGNIFYFIRKWFNDADSNVDAYEDRIKVLLKFNPTNTYLIRYIQRQIIYNRIRFYIGKPFVLCITCFGSLWGIVWFTTLNGISTPMLPYLILNCFGASFINTLIWKHYAKLD